MFSFRIRAKAVYRHAEQEVQRTGRAPDVWQSGQHRGVHGASRSEWPEQGMRIRHVLGQTVSHECNKGKLLST